jgi:LysR family transcriptional regulator, glycine cleavage system transcriptional activator
MNRQLPPLNALRAFESAARLGRMTAAADELSVTPGAISRQVQLLETHLGVELFAGSKNKPQLTPGAKTLLTSLSSAFNQIETAVRAVKGDGGGTLDVCCFSTFTVKWLIPRLYAFNALFPEIEIRLTAADTAAEPPQQRHDLVITAITATTEAGSANADCVPLFPERLGLVASPALAATMRLSRPKNIAAKMLLRTRTRGNAWQMWSSVQSLALPEPSGPEFEHYYFTIEAAIGGLGMCVAPWHLVSDDIRAGRLIAPFGFKESGYQYVAQRRRTAGAGNNKRLDKFCDWLAQQALETAGPEPVISQR